MMQQEVGSVAKVEINFTDKVLEERYGAPVHGSALAAAVDLRACPMYGGDGLENWSKRLPITIWPHGVFTFSAGFKMSMPRGLAALIIPRSGQGWKGMNLANSTGLIDPDYQGEIKIKLVNRGTEPMAIAPYDRVAQMIFVHYWEVQWERVAQFTRDTERGEGGFGSTGTT